MPTLPPIRVPQPPLRVIALHAISLRGAMTAEEIANALEALPDTRRVDINDLLETLVSRGDLCRFETSGAPVFASTQHRGVALAGRRVEFGILPDKDRGDIGPVDDADALLRLLGPPAWRAIIGGNTTLEEFARAADGADNPEASAWRRIAEKGERACSLVRLPEMAPAQLLRLSLLTEGWSMEERARLDEALRLWAGFAEIEPQSDPVQDRVISLSGDARTLVVAGPGAGKTHTVRGRLRALLGEGVPAPSITVVAFSRAAVAELRLRLKGLEDALSLDITTLDSLAGRLVSATRDKQVGGDYDATIRSLRALITQENRVVTGWLSQRQHIIFDEAQDIVGERKDLMFAILSALSERCGATVFCDPAQAIYDYRERQTGRAHPVPVDQALVEQASFEQEYLPRNHRTTNPNLLRLAEEGREVVEGSPDGHVALRRMRELLRAVCTEPLPEINGGIPFPKLSLFRTGGEAALHAARFAADGLPVRITGGSLSEEPPAFAPVWVARAMEVLHGRSQDALHDAAAAIAENPLAPGVAALADAMRGALWNGHYQKSRMAAAVLSGNALSLPDHPSTLWFSTVHAAKGREAEDVVLHLNSIKANGYSDWEAREEARVLYVAATRARRRLYLAPGGRTMRKHGIRYWRRWGRSIQVQLTRQDAAETVLLPNIDPYTNRNPVLRWQRETGLWALHAEMTTGGEVAVATLGERFAREIREICRVAMPGSGFIPVAQGSLRIEPLTLALEDSLAIVPVVEGFIWLNFKH